MSHPVETGVFSNAKSLRLIEMPCTSLRIPMRGSRESRVGLAVVAVFELNEGFCEVRSLTRKKTAVSESAADRQRPNPSKSTVGSSRKDLDPDHYVFKSAAASA
jgi:hypothetical protein